MTYHFISWLVLVIAFVVVIVLPVLAWCISPKYRRKLHRAYMMRDKSYPYHVLPAPVSAHNAGTIPYLLLPYPAEIKLNAELAERKRTCKRYDAKNAARRNMYPNRGRGRKTFNQTGRK